MGSVIDTIVVTLFVLFILYIFRGYHLSRLEKENEQENKRNND